MTTFCESESVLRDTISSFRKGHSTNTVLMGMRDDLLRAMKKGEVTLMVLADFSEAFGTVNYKVLITKLSTLGFSKLFLRWLNSYLSDRSHSYRSMIVHLNQWTHGLVCHKGQSLAQCYLISKFLICKIISLPRLVHFNVLTILQYTPAVQLLS